MSVEQRGKNVQPHWYSDMNLNKYFSSMILAKVKPIRTPNTDQYEVKFVNVCQER